MQWVTGDLGGGDGQDLAFLSNLYFLARTLQETL